MNYLLPEAALKKRTKLDYFRSAKGVESIFCEHINVKPRLDSFNKFYGLFLSIK